MWDRQKEREREHESMQEPSEVRGGHQMPWRWRDRQLRAAQHESLRRLLEEQYSNLLSHMSSPF